MKTGHAKFKIGHQASKPASTQAQEIPNFVDIFGPKIIGRTVDDSAQIVGARLAFGPHIVLYAGASANLKMSTASIPAICCKF